MKEVLGFATMGLLSFDLVCIIISISINYWTAIDTYIVGYHAGLWRSCVKSDFLGIAEICQAIGNDDKDVNVVRAMMILGQILTFCGLVTLALKQFMLKDKIEVLYATAVCLFLSAIFLLVGWTYAYAEIYKPLKDDNLLYEKLEIHAGGALAIISWILTSFGVGLTILMITMEKPEASVSASIA